MCGRSLKLKVRTLLTDIVPGTPLMATGAAKPGPAKRNVARATNGTAWDRVRTRLKRGNFILSSEAGSGRRTGMSGEEEVVSCLGLSIEDCRPEAGESVL